MPTDFERKLFDLLHTVTPEPPDHLAFPRAAATPEESQPDAGAAVVELATGTGHAVRRVQRWPIVVGAGAIVALAAGVVAATQIGRPGHPAPHRSAAIRTGIGTGPPTMTSPRATVPRCSSNQLVLASPAFATHGRAGTARLTDSNSWAKPCALVLPSVAIGRGATGGTPFPARPATIRIPGHGKVLVTARVRVTGRCHTAKRGLRINLIQEPFTYSSYLRVAGCTLTPLRLTHRVVS